MDEQDLRACVIDRVSDLIVRQAHVDRLQDGTHHGNGEIAFQIAVTVPVHHGDGAAVPRAELAQPAGEPRDALAQRRVGHPHLSAIDDFLVRRLKEWRVEQLLDQQWIGVGRGRGGLDVVSHLSLLES